MVCGRIPGARCAVLIVAVLIFFGLGGQSRTAGAQTSSSGTTLAAGAATATPTSLAVDTSFRIEAVRVQPLSAPLKWQPNGRSLRVVKPNQKVRLTTFIFVTSLPHPSDLTGNVTLSLGGDLWVSFPIHETLPAGTIDTRIRYSYLVRVSFPGTYLVTAAFSANGVQQSATQSFHVKQYFTPKLHISPDPAVAGKKVVVWLSSLVWPPNIHVSIQMQSGSLNVTKPGGWQLNCQCYVTYAILPASVSGKGALQVNASVDTSKKSYHVSSAFDVTHG